MHTVMCLAFFLPLVKSREVTNEITFLTNGILAFSVRSLKAVAPARAK